MQQSESLSLDVNPLLLLGARKDTLNFQMSTFQLYYLYPDSSHKSNFQVIFTTILFYFQEKKAKMVKFLNVLTLVLLTSVTEAKRNLKGKKGKKGKKKGKYPVQLGPRPYFMVNSMKEGELKDKLSKCAAKKMDFKPSDWSIGHRGACMQVSSINDTSSFLCKATHANITITHHYSICILFLVFSSLNTLLNLMKPPLLWEQESLSVMLPLQKIVN